MKMRILKVILNNSNQNIINEEDENNINNINNDNNLSLLNNNSNENVNNNSFINLLNDISATDSQKDKHTTLGKNQSKNSEDFPNIEDSNINNKPSNNLLGK